MNSDSTLREVIVEVGHFLAHSHRIKSDNCEHEMVLFSYRNANYEKLILVAYRKHGKFVRFSCSCTCVHIVLNEVTYYLKRKGFS